MRYQPEDGLNSRNGMPTAPGKLEIGDRSATDSLRAFMHFGTHAGE
jgi:hypothetical protein